LNQRPLFVCREADRTAARSVVSLVFAGLGVVMSFMLASIGYSQCDCQLRNSEVKLNAGLAIDRIGMRESRMEMKSW
jgi:hypothetical protein